MKTLMGLVLGGLLSVAAVGCDSNTANTAVDAPTTAGTTQSNQGDATDSVRKAQLESDIRSREQRNDTTGGDTDRTDGDLANQVRSKLEANIPKSQLTVTSDDGAVEVEGTVIDAANITKIEPLAREIKGVKTVAVNVKAASGQ
jgi:hyperosmotically inducible periplasmic protein